MRYTPFNPSRTHIADNCKNRPHNNRNPTLYAHCRRLETRIVFFVVFGERFPQRATFLIEKLQGEHRTDAPSSVFVFS